ncbi:nucleotidyltransferase [Mycoplasma sp. P36-A1]|uniref:nucleotidyltransferase n=1 Tax=Mycoplasma sp. P36-A1 TaxID=3252900 RepID=UPI003C2CF37A
MVITGIVVEYNPFHNGHIHHIKEARAKTNCDLLIAIMSPTFMQRGEPAVLNKYERAVAAVRNGVDLLIELPSIYAINSANYFAKGALSILNECQIDYLVFGSENNDVDSLINAARVSTSNEYQLLLKDYVKKGIRYANACNYAFNDLGIDSVKESNDILALAYIQEIVRNNYDIKPISILRTNSFLSKKTTGNISSATAIRHHLHNNKTIEKYSSMSQVLENNNELVNFNDYFYLLKYLVNTYSTSQLKEIYGFDEGLEFLFKKHINSTNNIFDYIDMLSSKRYPKTRIQRNIIYLLLNHTKTEHLNIKVDYIRILAMNKFAQTYIKTLKKLTTYHVISNFSAIKSNSLDFEKRVTFVYSCAKQNLDYLNKKEYQSKTIIV